MVMISKFKGAIGGALAYLQPLGAWLRQYVSESGQPWVRSPGTCALLAAVHHPDD